MKKGVLITITIVFFLFHLRGLHHGLPSGEIKSLLFQNESEASFFVTHIPQVVTEDRRLVEEKYTIPETGIFNGDETYWRHLSSPLSVSTDGTTYEVPRYVFKWMRNNLMSSTYPEENYVIHALSQMGLKPLNLNPHYFNFGGFYVYPLGAFLKLSSFVGLLHLTQDRSFYLEHPEEIGKLYWLGKIFLNLFFIGAVFIFYRITRRLYDNRAVAGWACLFYGLNPTLHVDTHFLKPHAYAQFWLLLSVLFSVRFFQEKRPRDLYLSGLIAGLAGGAYLPSALALLFLYFGACAYFPKRDLPKIFFQGGLLCLAGYVLTNPYLFVSWEEAWVNHFSRAKANMQGIGFFDLERHGHLLLKTPVKVFGLFAFVVAGGAFYALWRGNALDRLLLATATAFYVTTFRFLASRAPTNEAHNTLTVIPFLILLGVGGIARLLNLQRTRKTCVAFLGILLLCSTLQVVYYESLFNAPDPPIEAGRWINQQVPSSASIGAFMGLDGYFWGFPVFSYGKYRFVFDSDRGLENNKKAVPDYFVNVIHPIERFRLWRRYGTSNDPFLSSDLSEKYTLVKRFGQSAPPILARFFRPELVPFLTEEIAIFKRRR